MTALLDFIPLIAFFIAAKQFGVLTAAAVLLVATLVVYVIHAIKQKGKLTKQQWITLILTVVFCGLSLMFHDDTFLKWKSTVINSVLALGLIVSVVIGKPVMAMAMKQFFRLSPKGWNNLTLAWAGYFIVMAILQYYFAFFTSNDTWINFKAWGWMPVMLVFLVGQFVVLKNHLNPDMQQQIDDKKGK